MNTKNALYLAFLVWVCGILAACTASPQPQLSSAPAPTIQDSPTFTQPSPAFTLLPSATIRPSATPSPTPTLTVTPTLHPLTIAAERLRSYPGSDLQIEETLKPGANYDQYIVSYLSEGLKIYALLTVPRGEKPATGWPVIIFNHGYIPPKTYVTTEHYVAHVDILARNGYIVLKPDYRGHGKSQGVASGGYATPDYTVDDLNALASIQRYPAADPNRIGMMGHSMGGQVTLRAMVISKAIKAGVIWAGVVASAPVLVSEWHSPPPTETPTSVLHWHQQLAEQFGSPQDNPAFWASISPITYVADISGPLQLHHGTADTEVPYSFSVMLNEAMKQAGEPVEFFTYPGANHNLLNKDFTDAIYRTIKFFDKYVKGTSN